YYKGQNMTNNSNEYQRLGMYINQNTKQVGFIVNGVDHAFARPKSNHYHKPSARFAHERTVTALHETIGPK
ncbi:DUF4882 family protein, partial [Acinetobacter baumannii]